MNSRHALFALTLLAITLVPLAASGQSTDLDLRRGWNMYANSSSWDGKAATTVFNNLRFTQGDISIEANEGRTTTRENSSGVWQFSGNVIIEVSNGRIECDNALLQFESNELSIATVTGSPALFRLQRTDTTEPTVATAGKLNYDVRNGVIEFSEDASITEGGNQISSNFLVYNILEQRISADSNGDADGRVRITYTPSEETSESDAPDDDSNQ